MHLQRGHDSRSGAAPGPCNEGWSDVAPSPELAPSLVEFSRGPRTPEQLAVARGFLGEDGVLAFTEAIAAQAADVFRRLGSPRKRAADAAIGVTAAVHEAVLVTRGRRDFAGIPGLELEPAQ